MGSNPTPPAIYLRFCDHGGFDHPSRGRDGSALDTAFGGMSARLLPSELASGLPSRLRPCGRIDAGRRYLAGGSAFRHLDDGLQRRAFPSGRPQPGDHQRHRWMMRLWHWASPLREASTVYVVPDSDFMASDAYEGRRRDRPPSMSRRLVRPRQLRGWSNEVHRHTADPNGLHTEAPQVVQPGEDGGVLDHHRADIVRGDEATEGWRVSRDLPVRAEGPRRDQRGGTPT